MREQALEVYNSIVQGKIPDDFFSLPKEISYRVLLAARHPMNWKDGGHERVCNALQERAEELADLMMSIDRDHFVKNDLNRDLNDLEEPFLLVDNELNRLEGKAE